MSHTTPRGEVFLYRSGADDVYLNLAREEYLFDNLPEGSCGFLLYVDAPAVVFGKHQNPWRECSVADLRSRGIPLARRISGGGTVYHDLGNLNFSFILPKEGFDRKSNLSVIVSALDSLGLEARISERHDLMIGDRKISGNAFCFRRNRALHHGTLLVESRLGELRGALRGLSGIETFAVASNPSPVTNLAEVDSRLTIDRVSTELIRAVESRWGESSHPVHLGDQYVEREEVRALSERNREVAWIFDRTPQFSVRFRLPGYRISGLRDDTGSNAELVLQVEHGRVAGGSFQELSGFSAEEHGLLAERLTGARFDARELASSLEGIPAFVDLAGWLVEQGF